METDDSIDTRLISTKTQGYVAGDLVGLSLKAGEFCLASGESLLNQSHFDHALLVTSPIIKREGFNHIPLVSFDDIGALQEVKLRLEKLILNPLRYPELCEKFGLKKTAGVLLYGPPGCGKTMVAKAIANACRASFIYVKGPELLNKYFGESEKSVRDLFEKAR